MLRASARALLDEPRVPNPPGRSGWDWLLVGVLIALTAIEGVVTELVPPQPVDVATSVAAGIAVAIALLWRRSQPLAAVTFAFGTLTAVALASLIALEDWQLFAGAAVAGIVLAYSLTRWASGRHAAVGVVLVVLAQVLVELNDPDASALEVIVAGPFFLLPAVVGAAVRYRVSLRQGRIEETRLQERGQLARELHDSVAHHVSAIALQAQAAQAIEATKPDAAVKALAVIESEATRAMTEMRRIVGALRAGADAELAPQRGVADISSLGDADPDGPALDVSMVGSLDALDAAVDAGLYRLAREAITNARRHAQDATVITVRIEGTDQDVRLTVTDDGRPISRSSLRAAEQGYGLIGLAERATLLGGGLEAGPGPDRGWIVTAVVPRSDSRS